MSDANVKTRHFGESSRVSDFVRDEERALRVAKALVESGAYHVDAQMPKDRYFTWKSGIRAPCYCNCRELLSRSPYRRLVSAELAGAIRERFAKVDAVAGVATAGIAWAMSVADQMEIGFAYVRSEAKSHGLGGLVQGRLPSKGNIILVDDLVASGGSLVASAVAIERETDCQVVGIQTIVNWGFDSMRGRMDGRQFNALTSYPHILTAAMMKGLLSPADMQRFLDFYEDPSRGFGDA